jgi:osmotically-inducible protein OsmY
MKRRGRSRAPVPGSTPAKRSRPMRAGGATAARPASTTGRASSANRRTDAEICREICKRLARPVEDLELADLANERLDASDVRVSVEGGRVTVEGTVPERRMKPCIEALIEACPGVQDIDNRLRVRR